MRQLHHVVIRNPNRVARAHAGLWIDGVELIGVQSVTVSTGVDEVNRVTVTFLAESINKEDPDGKQPGAPEEGRQGPDRDQGDPDPGQDR